MVNIIKKNLFLLLILLGVLAFFHKTVLYGLLPIPSDTIVGLYHPYLDMMAKTNPAGVPFRNFLITDPVRQIIPWKELSIDLLSRAQLPLWNPYEMAGKPLLANFQSSPFYPINILLFIRPFYLSWSIFILIQPLLAGVFTFLYLKNLKLDSRACLLGAISFTFGGFSIAWLEWGNIGHTVLWLPLILLSIDKIVSSIEYKVLSIKNVWGFVLLVPMVSSFFAGHIQIFFYGYILSIVYFIFRWLENGRKVPLLVLYLILNTLFIILTSIQWIPTLQFINLSARSQDQNYLDIEGWFIPWQHLIQFLAPDFYGNPSTLNYWGTWNYAEFVGYVGIVSLFFAFCSILSKNKREVVFFIGAVIVSLFLALPTVIAKLPFDLLIPFLSSSQPTRLILVITFSLSILSALGFDYLIVGKRVNKKVIFGIGILFFVLFLMLWFIVLSKIDLKIMAESLMVAKRNLIFPSGIFAIGVILILGIIFVKETMARTLLIFLILALSFYDLFRFGTKFTPFTLQEYFYPQTRVIEFLQKDKDLFRIALTDSRIFPPNFPTHYKIQSIEGYDPLYLLSYAQLIAASERDDHSIHEPFGFNRIITPHNMNSKIIDHLNVKYVLSLSDLESEKLTKVFQEGNTRVYENKKASARAFFVERIIESIDSENTISGMFSQDLSRVAYVEKDEDGNGTFSVGEVLVINYSENKIELETENSGEGFLVLTDSYYPTWRAQIDGRQTTIYKTNHAFRGVIIPSGKHTVIFKNSLF